jgi:hypothetical protein
VHLYPDLAIPPAGLTPPALDVEGEATRLVASYLRLGCGREELPYMVKDLGVGGRVRARGSPDGALVYVYDLVYLLYAL